LAAAATPGNWRATSSVVAFNAVGAVLPLKTNARYQSAPTAARVGRADKIQEREGGVSFEIERGRSRRLHWPPRL